MNSGGMRYRVPATCRADCADARTLRRRGLIVGHMSDLSHIEPRDSLTPDRLAREAGTTPEYIARLVEAGAIAPDGDGLFAAETCPRSG